MGAVSYCATCGDFLFNGRHQGNVERWCRGLSETKTPETEIRIETEIPRETKIRGETENQALAASVNETKIRKRGRPRRETITPWAAAGMSRATWYRRQQGF
jgi:hypothetical protein